MFCSRGHSCHLVLTLPPCKAEGPNVIPDLHLPRPNDFIPQNLDVDKREVAEARLMIFMPLSHLTDEHCLSDSHSHALTSFARLLFRVYGIRKMIASGSQKPMSWWIFGRLSRTYIPLKCQHTHIALHSPVANESPLASVLTRSVCGISGREAD